VRIRKTQAAEDIWLAQPQSSMPQSHHRHETTLIGVLAVLKTAVSVTVLPSMLFALSIHSASGGRTGNSVMMITLNTGRFLSSHQDVCIAVFTLVAGLLARSQYSEGPATGHLDTGFSWFPCVYKQMLRWFPRFKFATTWFSCSPPDLNLLDHSN